MKQQLEYPLQLRSEEAQEIISKRPPVVIRWGSSIFMIVLLILLLLSYLVHYPDIVQAPFVLTSTNAPKSVTTKVTGKLVKLLVKEKQEVTLHTPLAFIESNAKHEEVLALEKTLTIKNQTFGKFNSLKTLKIDSLGELQPAYQTFQTAYLQYLSFLENGFYSKKKVLLEKELTDLQTLAINLEKQKDLHQKDLEIAESEFKIQEKLAEGKVIAPLELKREESKLLGKKMPLQQVENTIVNNFSAQTMKQKEILELDKLISEQENIFTQALYTFQSAIQEWKRNYVLSAPTSGEVHFSSFLQENQALRAGQELFFISTKQAQEFGEVAISQYNFGKVKEGQKVLIKLSGYPFHEFGMVEGRLDFVSEIPVKDSLFIGKVTLPQGLVTNYGKQLTYKAGMTAQADIITEDSRLIARFFHHFRKAVVR